MTAGIGAVPSGRLRPGWLGLGVAAIAAAGMVGVLVGPVSLGAGEVLGALADGLPFVNVDSGLSARDSAILFELRLPRVVLAGLVGATLAVGGAAYPGGFRNPLPDPYLLGAAAGAGLGATIVIAYGPPRGAWVVEPLPLAAFAGALSGVGLAYALGRSGNRARSTATLILAGVAVAAFFTAIQTYLQQRED